MTHMNLQGHHIDNEGHRTDAAVTILVTEVEQGTLVNVQIGASQTVTGGTIVVDLPFTATQIIEQGFQSWSTVRRTTPQDVRPERAEAPRWFRSQMLASRESAGTSLHGDGFLIFDGGVIGFLSAHTTFGTVLVRPDGSLAAMWLLDDLVIRPGDELTVDPLVIILDRPGRAYDRYAELSGAISGARTPRRSARVWCSWYQYFGAISPSVIRENLALAAAHNIEVVQIDDGWQAEIGVWDRPNAAWAEPMTTIAADIRATGCIAGIWTAPFLAIDGGTIATTHPEWLVLNQDGVPTTALVHGGWGGKVFALDTGNPAVLEHLTTTYAELRRQGFDYFKIDFLHAAAAVGTRVHGDTYSRAQALRAGLEAVRAGIGEDAYLVGCGSPLLSAVGLVDAMRVSEDVAPFYEPRVFFPGFEENTVAGRNAIEPSVLRAPLHRRWFTLDPDCVLLRPTDTELTRNEQVVIRDAALAASGFIALSDDLTLYNTDTWAEAAQLFADAERQEGTRSIVDPFATPLEVVTGAGSIVIDWTAPTVERR